MVYTEAHKKAYNKWAEKNPRTRYAGQLRRKFNLTLEQYDAIAESQDGACAICKGPPTRPFLCVDHDHDTNAIRGLLCNSCNSALGLFKDSPEILQAAITYLKQHGK